MSDQAERAATLRELHRPGDPLVLVNVWDPASARTVAALPGCRAIATASWAVAAVHGYPDGEQIPRELMLAAVERIAAAVDLPVTADLERGYGATPDAAAETVALAIAAGVVGANLEDRLRPLEEHAALVGAVRDRAEAEGIPFVINARSDEFLLGERSLETAIDRGRAYLAAGADSYFVPALQDIGAIRTLVAEVDGPVNILATPSSPPLRELAAAGVARVSFGPGALGVAHAAISQAAGTLLELGDYPPELAHRPATAG